MAAAFTARSGIDGFRMSLGQLVFTVACEREEQRREIYRNAIASRAAKGSKKDWAEFAKGFDDGDE